MNSLKLKVNLSKDVTTTIKGGWQFKFFLLLLCLEILDIFQWMLGISEITLDVSPPLIICFNESMAQEDQTGEKYN